MSNEVEIKWLSEPEEHDYPAALSYLSLLYDEQTATTYVDKLKHASISEFKAKDIFRASGLSLLGISNSHAKKETTVGARFIASPFDKRFSQWKSCHCGRISSIMRGLHL